MKYQCALIVVEDMKKTRFFYETLLNQKVQADFGENIGFEAGFAIHKKEHFTSLINNKKITLGSHSFELYFEEDNIENIEKKLVENNIEFLHKIVEQPWKQRVMRFYDYDKNIIEIGESMEYLVYRLNTESKYGIDDISTATGLPKEHVILLLEEYKKANCKEHNTGKIIEIK